jgi:hypothetical protein
MGAAVVLGQDLAEVAGPVGDGAVADLAARVTGSCVTVTGSGENLTCSRRSDEWQTAARLASADTGTTQRPDPRGRQDDDKVRQMPVDHGETMSRDGTTASRCPIGMGKAGL